MAGEKQFKKRGVNHHGCNVLSLLLHQLGHPILTLTIIMEVEHLP